MKYLLRTRFGEIVAEFLPPAARRSSRRSRDKIIIFCPGMPGSPFHKPLMEFLSRKGFWCFSLRYRGSWESGGKFLKLSPEKDVLEVVRRLPRGVKDLFTEKTHKVRPSAIYVIGSSFGGPAAILSSRDPRIARAVVVSSVVDWRVPSRAEPIGWMAKFVQAAFGEAYRGSRKDFLKLKTGRFYNPAAEAKSVDGKKLLIFHAKDDETVPYRPTVKFAQATGAKLVLLRRGGHLGSSFIMRPAVWKRIARWFDAPR